MRFEYEALSSCRAVAMTVNISEPQFLWADGINIFLLPYNDWLKFKWDKIYEGEL